MTQTRIFIHENLMHATKRNLFENLPKSINFFFSNKPNQTIKAKSDQINKVSIIKPIKELFKKILDLFGLPRIKIILPSKVIGFNYILSNYCLVLSTKKIILGPLEHLGDLVSYRYDKLNSPICSKFLKLYVLCNRCKYVFFMSESSKESFRKFLNIPQKRVSKLQVIYPTMHPFKEKKPSSSNEVVLLYIARLRSIQPEYSFYVKGGQLVINAYKNLKKKYSNLKLIFVGYIPPEYQEELATLMDIECYLKGYDGDIMNLYQKSDIFLFPSYIDGYGYTIIEAMANSLPVVCLNNHFAANELVLNNKTGFTVDTHLKYLRFPYTNFYPNWIRTRRFYDYIKNDDDIDTLKKFISKIEILIQNSNLRKNLGENGRERLINGDLSFSYRNNKLEKLFK